MVMPRSRSSGSLSRNCSTFSRVLMAPGHVEDAIGERAFAVIDVGDDREVTNLFGVGRHYWQASVRGAAV